MSEIPQSPHSIDLEERLLRSLIFDGAQFPIVRGIVSHDDFYILRYGWVWAAMERVHERGQAVDYVTVLEEMRAAGQIVEFGGPAELTRLTLGLDAAGVAVDYARRVAELAARRRGLAAASEIARLMHDETMSFEAVSDMAQAALLHAVAAQQGTPMVSVSKAASENYDDIERQRRDDVTGLATGFADLDGLLGGLQRSDLVIVAGRPGMGKTSFVLSLALHMMQARAGVPAVFSLEMARGQLAQRLVAMDDKASVTVKHQRTPARMTESQWASFVDATGRVSQLRGVLDDTGGLTPEQLRGKAQVAVARHGATCIIVDYLQLMKAPQYAKNRTQEVGYISHELKTLAKELNVPVIAAAQLNRAVETRQNKRPQMSDLRESGDIENDADVILFLYRDEYYNENSEFRNQVEVIVSKHRHGPTGHVALYFDAAKMRVRNLTRQSVDLRALDGPRSDNGAKDTVYRGGD